MFLLAASSNALFGINNISAQPSAASFVSSIAALQELPQVVDKLSPPVLKYPEWLKRQNAEEVAAAARTRSQRVSAHQARIVNYDIKTRGAIKANMTEFKAHVHATLNDPRGWARLGVYFQEVARGGGAFTVVLSQANQVPSFAPICSAEFSCQVGRFVIINEDRWLGATVAWNNAGGSLRDYRHMVVNHETGHWLGHGHTNCAGVGQLAPVMQQQSINLQGCSFNPWPLDSELWSSQLGIR